MLFRLFLRYEKCLQKYPIVTSSIQTGVLLATGDLIAQTWIEGNALRSIDIKRTGQFTTMGVFLVGPAVTMWYRFLARIFGTTGSTVAVKKLFCDQLIFAPVFIAVCLTAINVLKGCTVLKSLEETKKMYFDVLINNYKIWPFVIVCNFYFIPVRYQVLVTQSVAIGWNTYFSWKVQSTKTNVSKPIV